MKNKSMRGYPRLRPSTPEDYITIPPHERKYISFSGCSTGDYTEIRIEFGVENKEGFKEMKLSDFKHKMIFSELRGVMEHEFYRILGLDYYREYFTNQDKSIFYKITHRTHIYNNCTGMQYDDIIKEISFEEMRKVIDYKHCDIDLHPMLEHYKRKT